MLPLLLFNSEVGQNTSSRDIDLKAVYGLEKVPSLPVVDMVVMKREFFVQP